MPTHSTLCAPHSKGPFFSSSIWFLCCLVKSKIAAITQSFHLSYFRCLLYPQCNRLEWSLVALLRKYMKDIPSLHRNSTPTLHINATPRQNLSLTPRPETYFCLDRPRPSLNGRSSLLVDISLKEIRLPCGTLKRENKQ